MKYAIPIGLALGGVLSMLCGTYCIAADLELQQLGVDVDPTWSYLYTWVSCSMAVIATVTLEVVHRRECARWDEEMSRLQYTQRVSQSSKSINHDIDRLVENGEWEF